MRKREILPILVIDDSDEDYDVLTLTFRRMQIENEIFRCVAGEEVFPFLEARRLAQLPPVGLIMLDLNIIGMDGRMVLATLKNDVHHRAIPVLVFSTSSSPKDIESSYLAGASSYSVKPVDLAQLEDFVDALKRFWLDYSMLPKAAGLARPNG